jgi:hypothetical protein
MPNVNIKNTTAGAEHFYSAGVIRLFYAARGVTNGCYSDAKIAGVYRKLKANCK